MLKIFLTAIFFCLMIFNSATASAKVAPVIVINKFGQKIDADIPLKDAGKVVSDFLTEQFMDTGKFKIVAREDLEEILQVKDLKNPSTLLLIPKIDYVVSGRVKVERINEKNLRVICRVNISDTETEKTVWSGMVAVTEEFPRLKLYQKHEGTLCFNLLHIATYKIVFGELFKSPEFEKMFESD